jgi:hypothetical protein
LPVRPSDKGRMKVKTLWWLEAVAWDRSRGIWLYGLGLMYNLKKKNNFSGFDRNEA